MTATACASGSGMTLTSSRPTEGETRAGRAHQPTRGPLRPRPALSTPGGTVACLAASVTLFVPDRPGVREYRPDTHDLGCAVPPARHVTTPTLSPAPPGADSLHASICSFRLRSEPSPNPADRGHCTVLVPGRMAQQPLDALRTGIPRHARRYPLTGQLTQRHRHLLACLNTRLHQHETRPNRPCSADQIQPATTPRLS